jgi:hypothetical protein
MRIIVVLISLAGAAVAACASGGAGAPGSPSMETVRVESGNALMTTTMHPAINANGATLALPLDRTWAILRFVYDSLGIPVATMDAASHIIGNPDMKLRRRLGEVGLSTYINCGNAQGTPSAETYEIRMSVLTQAVSLNSTSTSVLTTVEARGRPITMSGEFTLCSSTGALERRVVDFVKATSK